MRISKTTILAFLLLFVAIGTMGAVNSADYEIDDDSYDTYFNENGISKGVIQDDDTLKIANVNNKDFVIDKKVNITKNNTNDKIVNGTITLANSSSSGSIIDGITINNIDKNGIIINEFNENIQILNNIIILEATSNFPAWSLYGIIATGFTDDVTISGNTINMTGVAGYNYAICVSVSNMLTDWSYGIASPDIYDISNNIINVNVDGNGWGIQIDGVINVVMENNYIDLKSLNEYGTLYGIYINDMSWLDDDNLGWMESISIINNTINGDAHIVYLIELCSIMMADLILIENNTLCGVGDGIYAIAAISTYDITLIGNDITAITNFIGNFTEFSYDMIEPGNVPIYLKGSSAYVSDNTIITNVNRIIYLVTGAYGDLDDEGDNTYFFLLNTTLSIDNVDINEGQNATITVTLKDMYDVPLANQEIKLTINSVDYYCTTDDDGIAIFIIEGLTAGIYSFDVDYLGNETYEEDDIDGMFVLSDSSATGNQIVIDYSDLQDAINYATGFKDGSDSSKYTVTSWNKLLATLKSAEEMNDAKDSSSQSAVDELIANLDKAIKDLDLAPVTPPSKPLNFTELNYELLSIAQLDQSKYTGESLTAFQNALTSAANIFSNSASTQADIDTYVSALKLAKNNLKAVGSAAPTTPPQKADLTISKVKRVGNSYKITIKNIGKAKAGKSKLLIKCPCGKYVKFVNVKALSKGQSVTITVKYFSYSKTKKHNKIFEINYNKAISESKYTNNIYKIAKA